MAKKFDEVDEIILNDLDNLVTYESFYSEDGMFLEDIYKKFQKDKVILDEINDKYSKKNGPTSTIMKDNRMINLKEIISKLSWAEKFHNLLNKENSNLNEFIELQAEYVKLEKKKIKNKKSNKEKKEKANIKKKEKNEEIKHNDTNNISKEINNKTDEDLQKEESKNLQFFKNEFNLLNSSIENNKYWRNLYENKLNDLIANVKEIENQEKLFDKDSLINEKEIIGNTTENKDINVKNQIDVSNNSTVKISKKKGAKNKRKKPSRKDKVDEEQIKNDLIEIEDESKQVKNIPLEEITFDIFDKKFNKEEFNQMIKGYENLKIKSNEEKESIEKQIRYYDEWEESYKKVKNMDLNKAQILLNKAQKLVVFSDNMNHLLKKFNNCINWIKDTELIIDYFKNILENFYVDHTENKIKIVDDNLIAEFIKKESINAINIQSDYQNDYLKKFNLNSFSDIMNHICMLKENFEKNDLIKLSCSNFLISLNSLEEKLNNCSYMINKILDDENNLDFLKYFTFQMQKFPKIFSDAINKIFSKINFIDNFENLINSEDSNNSLKTLQDLEAKLVELNINSEKIKNKIYEKKKMILDQEKILENLKKEYLEKGVIPDKNYLLDLQNKNRLNKLFLENKYTILLNSWSKYYDWYENIIKLLIKLNNQNKKNKNNAFISEKNGDQKKIAKESMDEQTSNETVKISSIEIEREYDGGINKISEELENDIELISNIEIERLKNLSSNIEKEYENLKKMDIEDSENENNNDNFEALELKGNFLNLKNNLDCAVIYKKISQIGSVYNIYGFTNDISEEKSYKMDLEFDSKSHDAETKQFNLFSLKDLFELYESIDIEKWGNKDILKEKINILRNLINEIKKWFKEFFELYHVQYLKNHLENFFLSKNLIDKLLPSKNQGFSAINNINYEYSKVNFNQIIEMKYFFELIELVSILTDFSKSIADLINLEKKINNGKKRKYEIVNTDYSNVKENFIKKIEKLNFEFITKALETDLYLIRDKFKDESLQLPIESNEIGNYFVKAEGNHYYSISFFNKIHIDKNSYNLDGLKNDLECILEKTHFNEEIEEEISFYKKWMEKYNQYYLNKQNKNYELIDLCLIEILISESHKSLFDISSEVVNLRKDIETNQKANETVNELIVKSNNFSFKLEEENEKNLSELISNINDFSDINIINRIKSLYWMQRAINFLLNSKARKSSNLNNKISIQSNNNNSNYRYDLINIDRLNYKNALKFSQEASSLFNFQDIKRKEYYISLMNQITAARNIRDVIDLIKTSNSNNVKQPISEDSFARIQTEIELCLIDLPEEIDLIEKFKKEKNTIIEKFNKFLEEIHTIKDYEKFQSELKNFGILLPKLIMKLERNISDSDNLNKEIKRLFDLHKSNKITLYKESIINILNKYKSLKINTESGKALEKMVELNEQRLEKLKDLTTNNENFELKLNLELNDELLNDNTNENNVLDFLDNSKGIDILDINSLLSNIEIHDDLEEKKIKKLLWLKKYEFIFEKGKYIPDFNFLKNMYNEINEISIVELNSYDKVDNLMSILKKSQDLINKILNTSNTEILQNLKDDAKELKIDLNEFFIQQEIKLECKGSDMKMDKTKKTKFTSNFYEMKNILYDNYNKRLNITNENLETKKTGNEQIKKTSDIAIVSGLIDIQNNPNADKIILNKNILNINLNSEIDKNIDQSKLLGNKRRNEEIVDLITNPNNDDFLHSKENQYLSQSRSRRNINVKIDKDFYYDKEFIKNFESLKEKNSSNKSLTDINKNITEEKGKNKIQLEDNEVENKQMINLLDNDIDKIEMENNKSDILLKKNSEINLLNESFVISGEVSDEEENDRSEKNNKINEIKDKEKSAYTYIYDSDKTEKRKNDVENIKRMINQGLKNPSLLKTGYNRTLDPLKESIRKNSLFQIQLALKENTIFYNKLGEEKLDIMADELEKQVKINNPLVNENYSKTVDTVIKVLKELKRYENVAMLIVKQKLNLNKVAFYPYGPKLIEKFRKINASALQKNKKTENDVEINKNLNQSNIKGNNNDNLILKGSKSNLKTNTKNNQLINKDVKKTKSDNLDFLSMMNEMNEFYNSLSATDTLKSKLEIGDEKNNDKNKKENQMTESLIKCNTSTSALDNSLSLPHDDLHMDDEDDDSLKSECELDNIKFSPTSKYEEKITLQESHLDVSMNNDDNSYTFNKKSDTNLNINITNNINLGSTDNNIKYISPFEKLYNPFELEEDDEEQRIILDQKGKKRNVCLPFFYNPDLNNKKSYLSEDKSLNLEFNIDAKSINGYLNNMEKSKKIYQIWKGKIQTSKLDFQVKFLTTYPNEVFSKLLNLPDTILLASKTTTKEVVNYIELNITKEEKLFLFSWVEIDDEKDIESYRKLADEYEKNDKTALVKNGDDKYYLFAISNKYSRLFRKITPSFEFINKDIMNKLEKIIAVAIVIKNPIIAYSGNTLKPILLEEKVYQEEIKDVTSNINEKNTINPYFYNDQHQNAYNYSDMNLADYSDNNLNNQDLELNNNNSNQDYFEDSNKYSDFNQENTEKSIKDIDDFNQNNDQLEVENDEEHDKLSSITDENEKSVEIDNIQEKENDKLTNEVNQNISEEANLELYLRNDDLTMLEDYVNRHFSNLSQEEMVNKLMSLDENFREKLLNLVMEYQQKISNEEIKETTNQTESGNILNQEENRLNQTEQKDNIIQNDYVETKNENSLQQNELINQTNQDAITNNLDYMENSQSINNVGFITNNHMINENAMVNSGTENQHIPNSQFYPNQNNMYYQQQNQYYQNMPQNYQNMAYNQNNNFHQNTRMMNNIAPPMNYPQNQNNYMNNQTYPMNNYQMPIRNQMHNPNFNMQQGGFRKGNYNNYGGNYNRNYGGHNHHRNDHRNQQDFSYNNQNRSAVNINYQNPTNKSNPKDDTDTNNPNNIN